MKTYSTQQIENLLLNFDSQLVEILKDDLHQQNQKIEATLINMVTRSYDTELLAIIKSDMSYLKSISASSNATFAQAG